jgi:hypothetical protein
VFLLVACEDFLSKIGWTMGVFPCYSGDVSGRGSAGKYARLGDDDAVGMSYTGSTPALGAGRPGSIPGIPTVSLSESLF